MSNQKDAFGKLLSDADICVEQLVNGMLDNLSDPISTLLLEACGQDHFPIDFDQNLFEKMEQCSTRSFDLFKSTLASGIRELAEPKPSFDVVALQFELEDDITKEQAIDLLNRFPSGEHVIPFFTSANNTSAAGFIKGSVFETFRVGDIDSLIIEFINSIIDDVKKESPNGIYDFNGVKISLQYKPLEGQRT